jgi:hypothetical protein
MKVNYLNNRDILKEIHRSKCTYSSFATDHDRDYDVIVNSVSDITIDLAAESKSTRAARIGRDNYYAYIKEAKKKELKASDFNIDPETYDVTDIVFRVMTFDHIPEEKGRKKTIKTEADKHVKLNFPPFQHFRFNKNHQLECVGKSHWKGDLETGKFSKSHGKMTNELGRMMLKLCERYGTRSNWRGYSYNDEMKGQALVQLVHVGLQFDESKSLNPFAYYTTTIKNSFTRILNIEKQIQDTRDDILEMNDMNPSHTRQANNEHTIAEARFYNDLNDNNENL